jgi:hypothetical protein
LQFSGLKEGAKARWEVRIKQDKEAEMKDYNSPLYALLQKTRRGLRRECKGQKNKPTWFLDFSPIRKTFGFENVPEKIIPKLQRKLGDYIDRPVVKKKHQHTWKLALEVQGILWLACADEECDAEDQLLMNDALGIVQKIILPYYHSLEKKTTLYRTPKERRRINKFLADNKENAIREAAREIDKQLLIFQKLLEDAMGKVSELKIQWLIRKLEQDRKDSRTAMLVL